AEAPVVEEVPEAPVVEEIAVEAPAEEPMEVRASLPGVGAVISGLYTEGDNPSSDAATVDVTAATIAAETAETGCDAAETPRVSGIDSYGEALPPMSDPVVRRPRSVRFRFNNGVLMNVDKGSEEGSRGPLE
ncbi:MAG: hypothetical protein Q4Q58_03330, partial [Thermoplasmata archaeon]|nr:hypothetical protein [Thermoplasmata archaeon]